MNSKRKKSSLKPKLDALTTVESQSIAVGPPYPGAVQKPSIPRKISEAAEQAFATWMKEVFWNRRWGASEPTAEPSRWCRAGPRRPRAGILRLCRGCCSRYRSEGRIGRNACGTNGCGPHDGHGVSEASSASEPDGLGCRSKRKSGHEAHAHVRKPDGSTKPLPGQGRAEMICSARGRTRNTMEK
jgi:hypothetical protein